MPLSEKKLGRGMHNHATRKWNWDVIFALYMGGLTSKDILALPEFKELSPAYLNNRIANEGWTKRRDDAKRQVKLLATLNMQEAMQGATEAHYRFMLKEILDERIIITNRTKTTGIADQQQRLALLEKYEGIANKALGLDDQKPGDAVKTGFQFLVSVHAQRGSGGSLSLIADQNPVAGPQTPTIGQLIDLEEGDITLSSRDGDTRNEKSPSEEQNILADAMTFNLPTPETIMENHRNSEPEKKVSMFKVKAK